MELGLLSLPSDVLLSIFGLSKECHSSLKLVSRRVYTIVNESYGETTVYCTKAENIERVLHRRLPFLRTLFLPYMSRYIWNLVARNCPYLVTLKVQHGYQENRFDSFQIPDATNLLSSPMLKKLSFIDDFSCGTDLFMLPFCPSLSVLCVSSADTSSGLEHISRCTNLQKLRCTITLPFSDFDHILTFLTSQVGGSLRKLHLWVPQNYHPSFLPILYLLLPQLTHVRIDGDEVFLDDHLNNCTQMQRCDSTKFVAAGYALTNLTSLDVTLFELPRSELADILTQLPRLRKLQVSIGDTSDVSDVSRFFVSTSLTDLAILGHAHLVVSTEHYWEDLPNLVKLEVLDVDSVNVTNLHLLTALESLIARTPTTGLQDPLISLKTLLIFGLSDAYRNLFQYAHSVTKLTLQYAPPIAGLENMSSLQELTILGDTNGRIAQFQQLHRVASHLHTLNFGLPASTTPPELSAYAFSFSKLAHLRNLSLSGGKLSAESLYQIMRSVSLRSLRLDCSGYTDDWLNVIERHGQCLSFLQVGIAPQSCSEHFRQVIGRLAEYNLSRARLRLTHGSAPPVFIYPGLTFSTFN